MQPPDGPVRPTGGLPRIGRLGLAVISLIVIGSVVVGAVLGGYFLSREPPASGTPLILYDGRYYQFAYQEITPPNCSSTFLQVVNSTVLKVTFMNATFELWIYAACPTPGGPRIIGNITEPDGTTSSFNIGALSTKALWTTPDARYGVLWNRAFAVLLLAPA